MQETPNANRLKIGFFGGCNVGKSTIINLMAGQNVAITSPVAGTTTDPVSKSMEILPLGPVILIDTAGNDDVTELGVLRKERSLQEVDKINLAVYVFRNTAKCTAEDLKYIKLLKEKNIGTLIIFNIDAEGVLKSWHDYLLAYPELKNFSDYVIEIDASKPETRDLLLQKISSIPVKDAEERGLLDGVITAGDLVVLVCPIDSGAPKGRLILPQVQMIREILDKKGIALVLQPHEIKDALANLHKEPRLVITDSQVFAEVEALLPPELPLTSFSILMARFKGDLKTLVEGIHALSHLKDGSKVLIAEGCTHRRQCDDIGTVKIPKWLAARGYQNLDLHWTSGQNFPSDLSQYELIIHCGGCMLTRREILSRLEQTKNSHIPIVNYGVLIAYLHGILDRAILPFTNKS